MIPPLYPPQASIPAIVVSRYNAAITDRLLDGAKRAFQARGGDPEALIVAHAPGAFELPVIALALASRPEVPGVLALGCIIRGETRHDRYIAHAVARGLTDVSLRTGKPAAFGVLTVESAQQADARSGAKSNKGEESMTALLDTIATCTAIYAGVRPAPASVRPEKARPAR